jgi:signal transduction histidine kinase
VKLFTRYSRINAGVTVTIFLITSIVLYFLIRQVLIIQLDQNFVRIRNRMQQYVDQHQDLPGPQLLDDLKVYYSLPGRQSPGPEHFESTHFYDSTLGKDHRFRKYFFPLRVNEDWYQVTLVKPLEGTHHVANVIVLTTIAVILVIILTSFLVNRVVLRKLWAPFYQAMTVMRGFKLGDKSAPDFPETNIEEFRVMNKNLRDATGKAAEDYRLLKEFTENASHEIQTPLAIIRSKLDLVIQDDSLSESQSEKLRSAYGAIRKISRLNQSLLLITKIDNRQYDHTEEVNVKENVAEKLSQFQELWENSRLTVSGELEEASINANPELIDILLNNLFSNATRHNIPGGRIQVKLRPGSLAIVNSGAPVSLDRDRLFKRFYKETPNSERVGLGLSIMRQICETSGILIQYQFRENTHIFSLTWPGNPRNFDILAL